LNESAREPAHRFDVIVVGSGAAGGWAAKQLTGQGLSVLLLEAGRTIRPEVDFPVPAPAENRIVTRITSGLFRQPMQMRAAAFNARTKRFFVDDRENPYVTPHDKPFNWFRGRQVGGRLHTWGRLALRLSELEIEGAGRDGCGIPWPLTYADLETRYAEVERFLALSGNRDGVDTVPDGEYYAETNLTAEESEFKTAIESAFPGRRVIAARLTRYDRDRVPSTIRAAEKTGRLVVQSDAVASHVTIDPQSGRADGVGFVDRINRNRRTVRARAVVLCASTIETVRILLNSASPQHPDGLGNSSGRLGRYLMDHVMVGLGGPLSNPPSGEGSETDPYDFGTATGFYIPRYCNVDRPHPEFKRGYAVQGGIGRGPSWFMLAQGEMLPRAENRIRLDDQKRDAWGVPAAHIECTLSSNENAMVEDATRSLREMANAAGLVIRMPPSGKILETLAYNLWKPKILARSGAFLPGSAIHEIGGAAMGADKATSVLNRFNQCWDAPNVFVTDGACFPSGCSQNITLTIMALTVRACEHLVSEFRAGKL
jgi:choline dehydrogenase-like flavoprotein